MKKKINKILYNLREKKNLKSIYLKKYLKKMIYSNKKKKKHFIIQYLLLNEKKYRIS
jgi:hypothetical protein